MGLSVGDIVLVEKTESGYVIIANITDADKLGGYEGSEYLLKTGGAMVGQLDARDHGPAATDEVVNVCYGTSATPPTASTTTIGTLYIQYTA